MKSQEIYNAWKEKKRQMDISKSFADSVMKQVYQYEQEEAKQVFNLGWLIDFISAHPLAQAGLVVAGTVVGLIRIAFVVCMFLRC